jgi:hypothetical protein
MGIWDPIGNPHSPECLCPNCGPTEYAFNVQAELERLADERERAAESQAMHRAIRECRERWDAGALAEEDKWTGISFRLAMGHEVTPEPKRWHDHVLAKMRERYTRTKGESQESVGEVIGTIVGLVLLVVVFSATTRAGSD